MWWGATAVSVVLIVCGSFIESHCRFRSWAGCDWVEHTR